MNTLMEALVRLRDDLKLWVTNNLQSLKDEVDSKSDFSGKYEDLADAPEITDDGEKDLKFIDDSGYIILKVDKNGLHTTNIDAKSISINGKNIVDQIQSSAPNIQVISQEDYYRLEKIDPNTLYIIE